MMFAVLGYQVANADAQAALKSVHRHLRPGEVSSSSMYGMGRRSWRSDPVIESR